MKKIINKCAGLIALANIVLGFSSCNLAGLDLQQDAKYNATPLQTNLKMTAYQFIESRKNIDMFMMSKAIARAGYRDSFAVNNRTYIVLNDLSFASYLSSKKYADVDHMPVDVIQTLLKQRTILGVYSSLDLSLTPKLVQTVDPSTALLLALNPPAANDANKYQVLVSQNTTPTSFKLIVTSNLRVTNGIIHVVEQQF